MPGPFQEDIEGDDIMDHELTMDFAYQHIADAEDVFDKAIERLALKVFNTLLVPFCDKNNVKFEVDLDSPYDMVPPPWYLSTLDGTMYLTEYNIVKVRTQDTSIWDGVDKIVELLNLSIAPFKNLSNYMPDYTPGVDND